MTMVPILHEGDQRNLSLDSKLKDLPLYEFQVDLDLTTGQDVATVFEQHPALPGVLLYQDGGFVGMISRARMMEYLLRPHGMDLFLKQPLKVLYSYARTHDLVFQGGTAILTAAQQALRRSPELLGEPILVRMEGDRYRLLNFHELNIAYWQLRGIESQVWYEQTQMAMLRTTRMASLGRLVDGVSHEILDPVSFIWGNLSHVGDYTRDLLGMISLYEQHFEEKPLDIQALEETIELDYLREDLPNTLESIKTGADRLSKLATSLQNFCHIDEVYPKPANVHNCLDGVLLLLKSRLTSDIEIRKHYGHLPPVPCFVGQLSQVFMNILSESINTLLTQAAADRVNSEMPSPIGTQALALSKPTIAIETEACSLDGSGNRWISVRIAHNAAVWDQDLEKEIADRIANYRPFTQETSLTSSYRMITGKHRGKFRVRSAVGPDSLLNHGMTSEIEILIPLT
jgi:signal transduction histidine kinase